MSNVIEDSEELVTLLLLLGVLGFLVYMFYLWRGLKPPSLGDLWGLLKEMLSKLWDALKAKIPDPGSGNPDDGSGEGRGQAQIITGTDKGQDDPYANYNAQQPDGVQTQ